MPDTPHNEGMSGVKILRGKKSKYQAAEDKKSKCLAAEEKKSKCLFAEEKKSKGLFAEEKIINWKIRARHPP